MKKIFTACLALYFCIGCTKTDKTESTIICGEVINADSLSPKVLTIFPYDFIVDGERFAKKMTNLNYKFHQDFMMSHRHDVAINYNGQFYVFMAQPGDSIFVNIDAKSKKIEFKGSNAEFNNQLIGAKEATLKKFHQIYHFDLDTNVEAVVGQLNEKMEIIKSTLDEYAETNQISEDVRNYVLDDNLYGFANFILPFDRKNKISSERYRLVSHPIFEITNSLKSHNYMYYTHVSNAWLDFIQSDPMIKQEYLKDEPDMAKILEMSHNCILQQPKSAMRDIMLTQAVRLAVETDLPTEILYDERVLDANNYHNAKFLELYVRPILHSKEQSQEVKLEGDIKIEAEMKYINSDHTVRALDSDDVFTHIKDKYKGKVIYLDVWATWCGPCMTEMKYAKGVYKFYNEESGIVFVNLCLNSNETDWIKAYKEGKIAGENYFVSGSDAAQLILSRYKLSGYPSYILIDKNGAIVTTSAYRPSELGKLSEQINKLL